MVNPALNFPLRGTGEKAWFGWPTDAKIEELRDAWFAAPDPRPIRRRPPRRCRSARSSSCRIIPTAQFILPTAYRTNISGLIIAPINLLWNVEKK